MNLAAFRTGRATAEPQENELRAPNRVVRSLIALRALPIYHSTRIDFCIDSCKLLVSIDRLRT
jgi:hypothetical protein